MSRHLAIVSVLLLVAPSSYAGIHTWDVSEVFTNADGTIQYVELQDTGTSGTETGVGNGSISSNTQSHSWSNGPVAPPTNGRFYLIATQGFADLPGAPTPDVILPPSVIPFFSAAGDSVAFGGFDTCAFASTPNNGIDAYNCFAAGTAVNSPTNYAGTTGSVDASGAAVPAMSTPLLLAAALALLTASLWWIPRRVRA